jgi:hypothetical protein
MTDESVTGGYFTSMDLPVERPVPDLRGALMAAAGALGAVGALVLAADVLDEARVFAVLVAALLVITGYGLLAAVPQAAPAAVVLVAAGAGALPPFLLFDEATDRLSGILALMTVLWALTWIAPLTQGRPFLLGLALAGAWLLVLDLADDGPPGSDGFLLDKTPYYLSLLVGAGFLAVTWALDRRRQPSLATPFAAVGDAAALVGAGGVAVDLGDLGGSVLVVVTGLTLGWVGHAGGRRLTTWLGAGVAGGGVFGIVAEIVGNDASDRAGGSALVVAGAVLVATLAIVERQRAGQLPATPVVVADEAPQARGGWHPDPAGRYASRWFDGTRWTDQIADDEGRRGTDPIDG